ncbi:MAG TPA: M36 family metallopeptidase [Gaiellaceae bacterium]|nr:M36 family metallopeptidase [Gaiellaceae bacterium]
MILLPGSALPVAQISDDVSANADYDSRSGAVAPTKLQRAHAKRIKANVRWGQFGTPASVSRRGKFLARGVRGKTAADAARWYLNRHMALFGLGSLAGLRIENVNRLVGSRGYAVNFRQVFGQLETSEGGLVTIGVAGTANRWKVAYVSSSLTRDRALRGTVRLSAAGAWAAAARSAGLTKTIANVLRQKRARGWTQLGVAGMQGNQLVKLVAFPTVRDGVLRAYETIVLDAKAPLAMRTFVDASSGKVLARANLVDNAASGRIKLAASESFSYSGELTATDGVCNTHGPFAIGTGNRALDGFAAATVPTNDLVLELVKDGTVLVHADTLFSPEQFHYEPAGGVPAGDYTIRVCDFDDPPAGPGGPGWAAPRTYTGTLTGDATPAPPAYLARWKVFPNLPQLYTLNQDPWNIPSIDTRETWCWIEAPGCDRLAGGALTSRGPWDHDHKANASTLTTRGNNAKSATSWMHNLVPSPPQYMPTSATRDYSYPWTNSWYADDCEPTPNGPPGSTWDDSAATVNLFMAHNRMHDWSYHLGFTERNWNAQDYNFGLTERRQENDPIVGDVQSGGLTTTRDNANMITLPDGTASITNMYFWQPLAGAFYAPCVDGDYDMGVIGHEYGHMIENRMIGKGNVRSGHHAGAMGESHGDLFGMEVVNEYGFTPVNDENRYAVGVYDTGNKQRAIRNYGMNFPTSGGVPQPGEQLMIDALNFSDMGYDVTGPQVHADGEIWSKTNFAIRQLLVDKYNGQFPYGDEELQRECAEGYLQANRCPGNRRWIQLVFDAMLLMPTNPTMLQARDAALAADLMRFGGANQKELWLGYARQGMGINAASSNTNANTDTDPTPDFEPMFTTPATVKFDVEGADGTDLKARIYVGHYEARVSPIADTDPATTGSSNLDDAAKFAPGTYELIAHAPGYGFHRFRRTFKSGKSYDLEIELPTNFASLASGATASTTDGAATVNNLIDDTEGTNWSAPATNVGGAISVDGKTATINLAGTDPVRVRYIQVSAMLGPGNNRFSALRAFEIWACNGKSADCSIAGGFTKVYTSPADAFPANPPRPVAPHLIMRQFDVPNFRATHVKFVVKTSQCTGGPAFQGDQDADPGNDSDCDTNVAATSTRSLVRSAELQVFRGQIDVDD